MKKLLAMVMAIVMMMAIAVPAFAATLDLATSAGDTTVIVNSKDGVGDGVWTVTIPATVNLIWDNDGMNEYSITSQLLTGKRVQVTLAKSVDLTSKTDANDVIPFTATDDTTGLSADEVVTDEVHIFHITVAPEAWDAVPYDVYEGQISFTAEVVDA